MRLNLEIKAADVLLTKGFYRWGGFTESSLEITQRALDKYVEQTSQGTSGNDYALAIEMLKWAYAVVPAEEKEMLNTLDLAKEIKEKINEENTVFPELEKEDSEHSLRGEIFVMAQERTTPTPQGEVDVYIDIKNKTVTFHGVHTIDGAEDQEYFSKIDFVKTNLELEALSFDQFKTFKQEITNLIKEGKEGFIDNAGNQQVIVG